MLSLLSCLIKKKEDKKIGIMTPFFGGELGLIWFVLFCLEGIERVSL